ncbi:hypothetical protein CEXT_559541 [Caerostris extrusa]|uniref:Uncharacterized protein n=1 Tax=Caerostris extrusa TaxID=172846 RepID=A0AAV4SNQ3_CAEEX|nr:hypothetical protein CEXT_559541 [Caerostris extrusa]
MIFAHLSSTDESSEEKIRSKHALKQNSLQHLDTKENRNPDTFQATQIHQWTWVHAWEVGGGGGDPCCIMIFAHLSSTDESRVRRRSKRTSQNIFHGIFIALVSTEQTM